MGEGKRWCRSGPWDEGGGGAHKEHFHIPTGMVVRGGRRHSICQPALHHDVTEKHFSLIKGTLTHLALFIIGGGLAGEEVRCGTGPGEAEGRCLKK